MLSAKCCEYYSVILRLERYKHLPVKYRALNIIQSNNVPAVSSDECTKISTKSNYHEAQHKVTAEANLKNFHMDNERSYIACFSWFCF